MTDTAHSHLPVLAQVLDKYRPRSVLEFGMGFGSTGLFLDRCLSVVSVEMQSVEWFHRSQRQFAGHPNRSAWSPVLRLGPDATWRGLAEYDMVFVDGHGDSRPEQIRTGMELAPLVVAHDTETESYGWGRIRDHLPDGWTWTDHKEFGPWTTVIRCA